MREEARTLDRTPGASPEKGGAQGEKPAKKPREERPGGQTEWGGLMSGNPGTQEGRGVGQEAEVHVVQCCSRNILRMTIGWI